MDTTEDMTALAVEERARKNNEAFKVLILALIMAVVCCSGVFADDAAQIMAASISNILALFQSPWVKGFACLAFIAECIALIFAGGQNPQIFKKFLPLLVGTVLFMCAGKIIDLIFGDEWHAADYTK